MSRKLSRIIGFAIVMAVGFGCEKAAEDTAADTAQTVQCPDHAGVIPGTTQCACLVGYTASGDVCVEDSVACGTGEVKDPASGQCTCDLAGGFVFDTKTQSCIKNPCDPGYKPDTNGQCADIDECYQQLDDCGENAKCFNDPGAFHCVCDTGYTGDGKTCTGGPTDCDPGYHKDPAGKCVDTDECYQALDDCDENANCFNKPASFECVCKVGFVGDGKTCTEKVCGPGYTKNAANGDCNDINECTNGSSNCAPFAEGGLCVNTAGGFKCNCKYGFEGDGTSCACGAGYTLGPSGTCVDDDECALGTDDCADAAVGGKCSNKPGSFFCSCTSGFSGDGKTCTCPDGYKITSAGQCVDVDECATGANNCTADGGKCTNKVGGFFCSCKPGYEGDGTSCQCAAGSAPNALGACADIDECATGANNCAAVGGKCTNKAGGFACSCKAGFVGDGTTCACAPGYTANALGVCVDVDECATGTDTCAADADGGKCTNKVGGFVCGCKTGFVGDGTTCVVTNCQAGYGEDASGACVEIDACAKGIDDCAPESQGGICTKTGPGTHTCSCQSGFVGDGKTCACAAGFTQNSSGVCVELDACAKGIDDCAAPSEGGICTKTGPGTFSCTCKAGFIGDGKTCACAEGYAKNASGSCVEINDCATDANDCAAPADGGVCTKTGPGKHVCTCKAGFVGDGKSCACAPGFTKNASGVCVDDDECASGKNDCAPSAGGGQCVNKPGSFYCACKTGAVGDGKTCACAEGYTFSATGTCVDVNECTAGLNDCAPTASGGKCLNKSGSFTCSCNTGFVGDGKSCSCPTGYEVNAAGACVDIDECAKGISGCAATSAGGTCTNKPGSFVCLCKAGYSGDGVVCTETGCDPGYVKNAAGSCVDIDECASGQNDCAPSTAGGQCSNKTGSFTCSCKAGFTGDGKTCGCAAGYAIGSSGSCVDIDECATGKDDCAADGGKCTNKPGGFTCACASGYTGDGKTCTATVCDAGYTKSATGTCVDINECTTGANDCASTAQGGVCTNSQGGFTCACKSGLVGDGKTCACAAGYQKDASGACVDINECLTGQNDCAPTSAGGQCSNKPGGFSCSCKAGLTGDGKTCACSKGYAVNAAGSCADIDECALGTSTCVPDADGGKCSNTPGSFTCSCKVGFTGNGATCTDIDECAANTDNCNQICTNTKGSFECSCNPGYKKDKNACPDINECLDPAAVGCFGFCENYGGSFNCWGKGGISSLEVSDGPYPDMQCAGSIGPDAIYYQTHKTSYDVDCRCPQGSSEPGTKYCSAPYGAAAGGFHLGDGPRVSDQVSGGIEGCATDYLSEEVYFGVNWGDFLDSTRGYIMAVDAVTGDRRIVTGSYNTPTDGVVHVGTGNRFDTIKDMAMGPDGMLYVFEVSLPGGGSQPDDTNPDLQGRSIYKVDLTTGARTLVWNQNTAAHPEFVSCPNGNPVASGIQVVDIQGHGFELDENGDFILATNDNTAPQAGEGFVRVGHDGKSCTWITRSGTKPGNLLFDVTEGAGSGVTVAAGFDSGFGYKDGFIYGTDFLTKRLYKVTVATGQRQILWSGAQPAVGNGPGVGVWQFFYYPHFGLWIAAGNEAGTPSTASLFDPASGDTWDWMYKKPDGAIDPGGSSQLGTNNSNWAGPLGIVTNQIRGPILGTQFSTLLHRPWCISPAEPNRLLVATDQVGIVKVEVETGNTMNFSL